MWIAWSSSSGFLLIFNIVGDLIVVKIFRFGTDRGWYFVAGIYVIATVIYVRVGFKDI